MNLEDAVLTSHIRATLAEVLTSADQLGRLAQTLNGFCDLSAVADAEEMRQLAIGIKASANHALATAAHVVGMSERLSTIAAMLDASIPPHGEPPANDEEAT